MWRIEKVMLSGKYGLTNIPRKIPASTNKSERYSNRLSVIATAIAYKTANTISNGNASYIQTYIKAKTARCLYLLSSNQRIPNASKPSESDWVRVMLMRYRNASETPSRANDKSQA